MKRYDVVINGVRTTLQLSDSDAKARNLLKDEAAATPLAAEVKAKAPANKSRQPANKARPRAAAPKV